jgi:5-methylcytosine-specific restriction endonuclease McrA
LPITIEFFHRYKNSKDGFKAKCKECIKIDNKEYQSREDVKLHRKSYYDADKKSKYGKIYRGENKTKALKYIKEYYSKNKLYLIKKNAEHYQENKEVISEKVKKYYVLNKEYIKVKSKNYYNSNINKCRESQKRYREDPKNKDVITACIKVNKTRRRNRVYNNGGSFTSKEWIDLINTYDRICLCCNTKTKLTADHVIPLVKGGSSNIDNIQPLCMKCNLKKGIKIIDYR